MLKSLCVRRLSRLMIVLLEDSTDEKKLDYGLSIQTLRV
jgi:hypothetical protein